MVRLTSDYGVGLDVGSVDASSEDEVGEAVALSSVLSASSVVSELVSSVAVPGATKVVPLRFAS